MLSMKPWALMLALACLAVPASSPAQPPPAATPAPPDPAALAGLRQRIVSGEIANVHSLLIARDDRILAEWYFDGTDTLRGGAAAPAKFDAETLHDLRSVTKSVVALLVGIAVHDGAIRSLDQPVLDSFPEYADLRTPERMRIRLRDLLAMGSGLAWDEDSYSYADPRNSETAMDLSPDRYRYVLSQPVVHAPGAEFNYSGGDVALMGAVLARAVHMPLDAYARKKLFAPLGTKEFVWLKDGAGTPIAASGLRLRPRDMLRLGQLVLAEGRWKGRQIVPADWIAEATSPHAQVAPDPACGLRYGYFWWLYPGCATHPVTPLIAAVGNGGQRIWVIPSRRLVVVATQGLYNDRPATNRNVTAIIRAILEPAAPAKAP